MDAFFDSSKGGGVKSYSSGASAVRGSSSGMAHPQLSDIAKKAGIVLLFVGGVGLSAVGAGLAATAVLPAIGASLAGSALVAAGTVKALNYALRKGFSR